MCKEIFRELKKTAKSSDVGYTEADVDKLEPTFVEDDSDDDDKNK